MRVITNVEIASFWQKMEAFHEQMLQVLMADADWNGLSILQKLSEKKKSVDGINVASSMTAIAELESELAYFSAQNALAVELHAFACECSQIVRESEKKAAVGQTGLVRKLFSMHSFLDGVSGAEEFGQVRAEMGGDVRFGLGLGLKDGSLHRFFTRLVEADSPQLGMMARCFDREAGGLVEAIETGQTGFEQYFEHQLILRYDPIMSRKTFDLSDCFHDRFARLGAEPLARSVQVELVAGDRFEKAKKHAGASGIRSLRGFAMLFDINEPACDEIVSCVGREPGEVQKCLSLADAVIGRMHGHLASHWQNRLESVFRGSGWVDGRLYDERRFFGDNVEEKAWNADDLDAPDEDVSSEPEPGHTYIACPGDRISSLTERAYHGQGDYRFVLRQNPHISRPDCLEPGTRIYFPEIHRRDLSETKCAPQTSVKWSQDDVIVCSNRVISAVYPLTAGQRTSFCEALNSIQETRLCYACVVELPVGAAIVCQRETLLISEEENEKRASEKYPGREKPVLSWLEELASQIRGDVILKNGAQLPLASLAGQKHRAQWMAASLNRYIGLEEKAALKLIIHVKSRCVDVVDDRDGVILRLEDEDFHAIRQQPLRRLSDYVAPPVVQMNALSQIWLSAALQMPCEIAVPPLSQVNQFSSIPFDSGIQFFVPMGTAVFPMMAGTVVDCGRFPGCGEGILLRHHHGLYSRYTCLAAVWVKPGERVLADTMMGRSGCSIMDMQPMLRLELKYSENEIIDWFGFEGQSLEYLNVVCNIWPQDAYFDVIMGE